MLALAYEFILILKTCLGFFDSEQTQTGINTTIIYSANRKEVDPKQIKETFSKSVSLIEINMMREFSH
jgi:hypothetical protein